MIDLEPLEAATQSASLDARWWPIRVEPLPGSGEQLTIGVVVAVAGKHLVKLAPELDRLRCLYDQQARVLIDAASIVASDMRALLDKGQAPDKLLSEVSLGGFRLGEPRPAIGESIEEIADLALATSSSFAARLASSVMVAADQVEVAADAYRPTGKLRRVVQQLVVARNPQLKSAFNAPIAKVNRRRAPRLDFRGARLAATFDDVSPRSVSDALQATRISIYTLDLHRDLDLATKAARHVAYIVIPPRAYDRNDLRRLEDARGQIRHMATSHAISLEERPSPVAIADEIVRLELAA
jgi:hypothetical protein